MANQIPNPHSNPSSNSSPNLIDLVPQAHTVKELTGNDPNYTIHTFLRVCEDNMATANVTHPSDKLKLIRGHVESDSVASSLLIASAFTDQVIYMITNNSVRHFLIFLDVVC